MTDTQRASTEAATAPLPDLVLYTREGCHLCADARAIVDTLLEERADGRAVIERDITTNDAWHRAYLTTIPVLELGNRRLELATSPAKIRRFLDGD
jgi:Glutaredoxin-like domain (DUF836)